MKQLHPLIFFVLTLIVLTNIGRDIQANESQAQIRQDAIIVRAAERMTDLDVSGHPQVQRAIERYLNRIQGTPEFIRLVKRFQPAGIETKLFKTVLSDNRTAAVEAGELLLEIDAGRQLINQRLRDPQSGPQIAEVLGLLGNGRSISILARVVADADVGYPIRREAVVGLNRSAPGKKRLIELAKSKELVGDTFLIAGSLLAKSANPEIRNSAASVLPLPAQKDSKPMPPVDELAKISGDAEKGLQLFRSTGTCANCHIVDKYGKDVGPNLSEIGSKLSREAMLTAILAPSAGISHNYENYAVLTDEGQVITGLKVSETEDEVVIRTAEAIDRKISTDRIERMKKSEKSIMPENLHHATGQQGLIDIVEYMMTLKKKS